MQTRNISRKMIEECLNKPDKVVLGEELLAVKKIDDKALVVVFKKENNDNVVITVFITSKIHKYL